MNALSKITDTYPTPEQWMQVEALAETLDPDQALWLSGYFAGLGRSARAVRDGGHVAPPFAGLPVDGRQSGIPVRTLTVLYGSETGNSADLARRIEMRAEELGLDASISDMASYKARLLKDEQDLLIVTSTHGEGDPPEPAADFFEFVLGRKAPKLDGVRYAVLGLGDSTYEFFCGASKRLDERFAELGAERFFERLDCDVDYDEPAAAWMEKVLGKLAEASVAGASAAALPKAAPLPSRTSPSAAAHDRRNPFDAPVLDNFVLTGRGSSKETRHVELSIDDSNLTYEPGDALGFLPHNDPMLVEKLLNTAGLDPNATVAVKSGSTILAEALESHFEITTLTPRFVEHWASLSDAKALRELLVPENRPALTTFIRQNHVIDLLRSHAVPGLVAGDFTAGLRALQPRLYSIASSASAVPDEVHLTVSTVRYDLNDESRCGVASGFLADRLSDDDTLPIYIQSNPHFRLPANDETPIIMIGAGTGIAPYRAFLQEREARGSRGRSWLFFGERNFRTDFLYQVEWQKFLDDGILTRMDVAFSRDQAEKIYVQHRLREAGRTLYEWLEEGAHVYVCGDATALAPDVHQALVGIAVDEGGLGPEKAEEYMRNLQRDGRYQRDVY